MTDTATKHTMRRGMSRRIITVVVSVLVTLSLCVGYVVADITDVLPGVLTLQPVDELNIEAPSDALQPAVIAGQVEDKAIDASAAQAAIQSLLQASGVGSDVSVSISDASGSVVADHESGTPREPASTMKTLTSLAAASVLDMGSTLDTQSYLNQEQGQGATVFLKGNGDMLLGSGASDINHVNGRAGLGTLAENTAAALKQRGITTIKLSYDDSLFGDVRSPANIATNNPGNLYFTGVSSMAVDGGRQWTVAPSNPDTFDTYVELSTDTAKDAAATFATRLQEHGITVESISAGTVPQGLSPLSSVSSATLSEIMAFMLRHSDNTLAEEFGRLTALKLNEANSPAGAVQAVSTELSALGIDINGLTMADCSGLSPGSSLTVNTLVQVQAYNLRASGAAAAAEGLSIPGLVGTASDRLADKDAAGLLRVKTGSLDEVTSMAGNVSRKNGGTLAFAVIVNNPEELESAKTAINEFMAGLAEL